MIIARDGSWTLEIDGSAMTVAAPGSDHRSVLKGPGAEGATVELWWLDSGTAERVWRRKGIGIYRTERLVLSRDGGTLTVDEVVLSPPAEQTVRRTIRWRRAQHP